MRVRKANRIFLRRHREDQRRVDPTGVVGETHLEEPQLAVKEALKGNPLVGLLTREKHRGTEERAFTARSEL